ncbi:MAG: (Dimethylallyl)adenosine tRNA methylthiotransferase MiaB [Candidatus Levybacteria bacterium GW2011_GWA2_40_8]|nr:MAG: (Dimethylallyl)adenosine tRNA methylthiotransferase MiaB [Candidatus Levybacteria bacterium GW2011_GWA2_40_8]
MLNTKNYEKYFIKTFGCAANVADSERIAAYLNEQGMKKTENIKKADWVVINTCMVRESAENRVYGLVNNITKLKTYSPTSKSRSKIIITGCMAGMAISDKSGKLLKLFKKKMPQVDEFLPIEEIGFAYEPARTNREHALVPISNGCNNFCTYCVVPYTRGREVSRSFEEIINECQKLYKQGFKKVTLLGQNVNSYGSDLIKSKIKNAKGNISNKNLKIKVSSNPWDFSDELIKTIAQNPNITRTIHLPVQSGDDEILKRMNRWYTHNEYLQLVAKIKKHIAKIKFTTDIIVGFCGETKEQFENTFNLCKKVGFEKAYVAIYSNRPTTEASKRFKNNIPFAEKKRRWMVLEKLINYPNLKK